MSTSISPRLRRWLVLGLALGLLGGCKPPHESVHFKDVSREAGLAGDRFTGSTQHNLGVNWIDFDGDDWPDLFATNGHGSLPHLYRNLGDGTFETVDELLPELPRLEQAGSVFADYDNDGDPDIFVQTTHEQFELFGDNLLDGPPNILLRNLFVENGGRVIDGEPLFERAEVEAGVEDLPAEPFGNDYAGRRAMTGGWIDYDLDGCIDLFIGQMALQAGGHPANRPTLFRNRCDGTFEDTTLQSRVSRGGPDGQPFLNRPALAFFGGHLDADSWPDMYVVNVHEPNPHHWDFLYRNEFDGTFSEITELDEQMPGIGDDSGGGMGIDVADIDLDGDWDIYLTDIYRTTYDEDPLGNVLYLGKGDGSFEDNVAPEAGVEASFSWGASFFDLDRDGWEDLFVAATDRPNHLFHNFRDGSFVDIGVAAGMGRTTVTRGSATADYDRDGDVDLAVVNSGGSVRLFRNDSAAVGSWISISLEAVSSNRSAIGTVLRARAGELQMMRQVKGGSSAHSQDELVVHFGLGDASSVDELRVEWPSGVVDVLHDLPGGERLHLVEGSAAE